MLGGYLLHRPEPPRHVEVGPPPIAVPVEGVPPQDADIIKPNLMPKLQE